MTSRKVPSIFPLRQDELSEAHQFPISAKSKIHVKTGQCHKPSTAEKPQRLQNQTVEGEDPQQTWQVLHGQPTERRHLGVQLPRLDP